MPSPTPKRPDSIGRHGSSWMKKIHRKHDAIHHPEQAPLLQAEPEETTPDHETPAPSTARDRLAPIKSFASHASGFVAQTATRCYNQTTSGVGSAAKSASNTVRRNPKKVLAVTTGIFAATSIGEGVDIIRHHPLPTPPAICYTPECVHAANMILLNMNPSVLHSQNFWASAKNIDPCVDFDKFVCGGFEHQQFDGDSVHFVSGTTLAMDAVNHEIRHILDQDRSDVQPRDLFGKAKIAYTACVNATAIKEAGLTPLKILVKDIGAQFGTHHSALRTPLPMQIAIDAPFTPAYMLAIRQGFAPFIDLRASSSLNMVTAYPVSPLGVLEARQQGKLHIYANVTRSMLERVIGEPSDNRSAAVLTQRRKSFDKIIDNVVELELRLQELAQLYASPSTLDSYESLPLHEIDHVLPRLSIPQIATEISSKEVKTLLVPSAKYLVDLADSIASAPTEIIEAYFILTAIKYFADHVEHDALLSWKRLIRDLKQGQEPRGLYRSMDRENMCIMTLGADRQSRRTRLSWIISELWLERHPFPSQHQKLANTIITKVKSQYRSRLQQHEDATKKLEDMQIHVLDQSIPTAVVQNMYKDLEFNASDHFSNMLRIAHWEFGWSKSNEWNPPPSSVQPYYSPLSNEVFLPTAGARRPFFYHPSVPSYLQYGSFGSIVGHEIAHAFGSANSWQLPHGHGTWPSYLWSNETRGKLEKQEQCFSKHSTNPSSGGQLSLSKVVADYEGLLTAFEAWKKQEGSEMGLGLPGLSQFSHDQLFWIAFGNTHCSKMGSKQTRKTADKPPGNFATAAQIKGAVANHEGFLNAFHCSEKPKCSWF